MDGGALIQVLACQIGRTVVVKSYIVQRGPRRSTLMASVMRHLHRGPEPLPTVLSRMSQGHACCAPQQDRHRLGAGVSARRVGVF